VSSQTDKLNVALTVSAESEAAGQFAAGVGSIAGRGAVDVAKTLGAMARKYIENVNSDAIGLSCLQELSSDGLKGEKSALSEICAKILPAIVTNQRDTLNKILANHATSLRLQSEGANLDATLEALKARVDAAQAIKGALDGAKK
jgi:hypothetical protein